MAMQVAQRMTADEFLALPLTPGAKRDWKQVVEGEIVVDRRPYPIPALAVEVRSPSTWRYDIGAKKAAFPPPP